MEKLKCPIARGANATCNRAARAEPDSTLSILIVEDEEDTAESACELLTLCGYVVRIARCGMDALRDANATTPDVVLLDIGLPDMNGWDVAGHLRSQTAGKQPLVIAITGYGDATAQGRSAGAGIDVHLVKPADPPALLELLAEVQESLAELRRTRGTP